MFVTSPNIKRSFTRMTVFASLMIVASFSSAVAPIEANFILGMDIQGQRLNLYRDCEEGSVTCDNMLLVAPDLGRLLQTKQVGKKLDNTPYLNNTPYSVKLYAAKTKHSVCKDGVTPCRFQGYVFEGKDFNGFIDPSNHEIYIGSNSTSDGHNFSYKENTTYLPLASQAGLIDGIYETSDQEINGSYHDIRQEVSRLYGEEMAADLKQEQKQKQKQKQKQWIKQRSKDCGANASHQPRTQAEKVCFIQQNNTREQAWFLWID
ncbi:lysozyme inhibitor LprI family protein [Psychrobacter sp. AOP5-GZ1-6]|uniref:lysozyme inhibitor LprI family protein n=1 Tax=unclassified Psychrobacter TaxID=196806 RepID=UPI00402B0912